MYFLKKDVTHWRMKMFKPVLGIVIVLLCIGNSTVHAQDVDDTAPVDENKHKNAIGISLGAKGAGLSYAYNVSKKLALRTQFDIIAYDLDMILQYNQDQDFRMTSDFEMINIGLYADYFFKENFYGVLGFAMLMNNSFEGQASSPEEQYAIGNRVFTREEVGVINGVVTINRYRPYLGFGFRFWKGSRSCFSIEPGIFYHGSPKFEMTATKFFAPNVSEAETVEDNIKGYQWQPNLEAKFNYFF